MKKLILASLVALMALTVAAPAMAAESTADVFLNRPQQVKELTNVEVVYTETGVDINITVDEGPIWPTLHLFDIYANELDSRGYSAKDRIILSFSSITNGFAIHFDGTSEKWVEKIQRNFSQGTLPIKVAYPLSVFLANHGIN
jgi:hypothetical protein